MQATRNADSDRGFMIRSFVQDEAFSGILLLTCAIVALTWVNSPWGESYDTLWATEVTLGLLHFSHTDTLHHWINDGLMAIFFLVVGLEIKRELLAGELASMRRASLPIVAALGGIVAPALIYVALNRGTEGVAGWGIPMATDIAFALGVLALLGDRIPLGLKVFLTALAIVDDIAAVVVIALFYTSQVSWVALGIAVLVVAVLIGMNRMGVRRPAFYGLLGIALWAAMYTSGVHATIAGILLAMTIPANTRIDSAAFLEKSRGLLDHFEEAGQADYPSEHILANGERQEALAELEDAVEAAGAPLQRMEHTLHPWVAYAIVPLFALANAGVRLEGDPGMILSDRITLGVLLGLFVGKQVGITLASWLAVRAGIADLPDGVTWRSLHGAALLGGIGFTMALFVADLAFASAGEPALMNAAKVGILLASLVSGVLGYLLLSRTQVRPS
jgi:NhaA family Na+:H+ antiporter